MLLLLNLVFLKSMHFFCTVTNIHAQKQQLKNKEKLSLFGLITGTILTNFVIRYCSVFIVKFELLLHLEEINFK